MARCIICRKPGLRCGCWDKPAQAETQKVTVKSPKTGRTSTKTVKTGNTTRNGFTYCGKCTCRVNNGKCSNVTCSTNK